MKDARGAAFLPINPADAPPPDIHTCVTRKDIGVNEVRDAAFLHGYSVPVLLLLHEPDPTWPGRYRWVHLDWTFMCTWGGTSGHGLSLLLTAVPAPPPVIRERKDTCAVIALSLGMQQRKQQVWSWPGFGIG